MEEIDVRECQKNNLVDESNYSFVMCKNSSGNYRTLCYFHFPLIIIVLVEFKNLMKGSLMITQKERLDQFKTQFSIKNVSICCNI